MDGEELVIEFLCGVFVAFDGGVEPFVLFAFLFVGLFLVAVPMIGVDSFACGEYEGKLFAS